MRYLLLLPLLVLLLTCREQKTTTATGDVAPTGEIVTGSVNPRNRLVENRDEVGNGEQALVLRMGDAEAAPGDQACLPVEVSNFRDLIGFQFTVRFDSASLKFETLRNFGLPGYGSGNFGVRFAERGYLSTLWTENNLQGVTRPDGTPIVEICFTNLMGKGQRTEVKFQDGPTKFEVIGAAMDKRKIRHAAGVVVSR